MADFEPYPDLPGQDAPSPEALSVSRHNAEWAKTFEGGTTSLMQQARHRQDIKQYAVDLAATREAEQAHRIATDKDAHDMWMKERAFTLNEKKTYEAMDNARRRADSALRLEPLIADAKKAQIAAQTANAAKVAQQTRAQSEVQAAADHFHAKVAIAQSQYAPDSPEYERAIIEAGNTHAIARHDKTVNDQFLAAQKSIAARRVEGVRAGAAATADAHNLAAAALKSHTAPDPEVLALRKTLEEAAYAQANSKNPKEYDPGIADLRAKLAAKKEALMSTVPTQASSPAQTAASAFKEGDTRTKDGKTYKRDANGTWHPQL